MTKLYYAFLSAIAWLLLKATPKTRVLKGARHSLTFYRKQLKLRGEIEAQPPLPKNLPVFEVSEPNPGTDAQGVGVAEHEEPYANEDAVIDATVERSKAMVRADNRMAKANGEPKYPNKVR